MTEYDYRSWVARTQAFVTGIGRLPGGAVESVFVAPRATHNDLATVERALSAALPGSLRGFFADGSAALDCRYAVDPEGDRLEELEELLDEERIFGGPTFGPLTDLPEMSSRVVAWARETWIADDAEQRRIWESALPFAALNNGDFLAVDLRSGRSDPPIVYLNHEDESVTISPSFDSFLSAWEGLCYIGPEHWLLLQFTAADGSLDANSDRAARLRRLLTV